MPTLQVSMSSPRVVFMTTQLSTIALVVLSLGALLLPLPQAEARAFFVFGDSLVDNGNNNYLATTARADSPPYGIDYPTHRPTGRFSNGLNLPDIISEFFHFIFSFIISKTTSFLSPPGSMKFHAWWFSLS